jgi:hypothetical protein
MKNLNDGCKKHFTSNLHYSFHVSFANHLQIVLKENKGNY